MNKIGMTTIALVCALVLLAVSVAPAMAGPTPPTPYIIKYGYVFYANGSDCNGPIVNVTNTNTSNTWRAETNASYNYYELVLADGTDVNVSEVLQFDSKDPAETQFNTTEHAVTQTELNNGGLFSFNITLHPPPMPDLVVTDIWCKNGTKRNTYNISYNITNIGYAKASKSVSSLTVDGGRMKRDRVKPLAVGEARTESFVYRSKTAPTTIKVCADFNSRVPESDETNNCLEKTVTCT